MEMADAPFFWDIVGPLAIVLFLVFLVLSIWGYRIGSAWIVLVCTPVSAAVGFMTTWSIGSIFLIVAILQLIAALYLFFRKKEVKNES